MNKKSVNRLLSLSLCMVLIAALALFASGCGNETTSTPVSSAETPAASSPASAPEAAQASTTELGSVAEENAAVQMEMTPLGEGQTQFAFVVVDADGNETAFDIHTDQKTVGEALLELELIAGDDSEYGLYVKTVNGITADYDTNGTYWAFYINEEYASTGVDATDIVPGSTYTFKVEAG